MTVAMAADSAERGESASQGDPRTATESGKKPAARSTPNFPGSLSSRKPFLLLKTVLSYVCLESPDVLRTGGRNKNKCPNLPASLGLQNHTAPQRAWR